MQFLDVSIDTAYEVPMALLVVSDDTNGANGAMKRLFLNGGISDANLLLTLDGDDEFCWCFD